MSEKQEPPANQIPAGLPPEAALGFVLEKLERHELVGRHVKLSDGRDGEIVHVEYESPQRVALVKTFAESPSPLTRVGLDRLSPGHLPYIVELDDCEQKS